MIQKEPHTQASVTLYSFLLNIHNCYDTRIGRPRIDITYISRHRYCPYVCSLPVQEQTLYERYTYNRNVTL